MMVVCVVEEEERCVRNGDGDGGDGIVLVGMVLCWRTEPAGILVSQLEFYSC